MESRSYQLQIGWSFMAFANDFCYCSGGVAVLDWAEHIGGVDASLPHCVDYSDVKANAARAFEEIIQFDILNDVCAANLRIDIASLAVIGSKPDTDNLLPNKRSFPPAFHAHTSE